MRRSTDTCFPHRRTLCAFVCAAALMSAEGRANAANVQTVLTYDSTVTSAAGHPIDLKAELNYDSARMDAPIAVVMHGYSGSTGKMAEVRNNAVRLRDAGFFVISVALRGRDGGQGTRDSGGVEIYDIYDAVERVKSQFGPLVDESNVHITGYSGGGGNTMSALTKFPDYFRAGASYFGMSDYGYDGQHGWYNNGAESSHRSQLNMDVGNPILGIPAVLDRYMARTSSLASRNNPYSEIHLFVNADEDVCPPSHDLAYQQNAVAAATTPAEFDNITVHVGGPGQYHDFNNNGANDANELQSWPHGYPNANQQQAAESWYLSRLLDGSLPEPILNLADELFVAGFVRTKQFQLWLGDGQNAAGNLVYDRSGNAWTFDLAIASSNKSVEGALDVNTADWNGRQVEARLNDQLVDSFVGGGWRKFTGVGDGDRLTLSFVPMTGDLNLDGRVDIFDVAIVSNQWGANGAPGEVEGDANRDGTVDIFDVALISNHWAPDAVAAVPEPSAWLLAMLATAGGLIRAW